MEKKITLRQMSILCFISVLSLKLTLLPSIIHQEIGVNAFLLIGIYCLIDLATFFPIYYVLKRNQDTTFYVFLQRTVGKFIGKIIFLLIFLFFLFKLFLLLDGGYAYAREVIFQEAPLVLFYYILVVCCISMYLFGLKSFARTAEFFYPIIIFLIILFLVIPFMTTKIYDVRPLLNISAGKFGKAVFQYLIACGDFTFLLLFMGKIKFEKKKTIWSVLSRIFYSFLLITFFYFVFVSVFKYTGFLHPNAISEIVQFVPTPSVLGNFDWLTIMFVLLVFLLNGGLFTYGMCGAMSNVLYYEGYDKKKMDVGISIIVYIIMVIILFNFIDTFEDFAILSKNYLPYFGLVIISLPFFIWAIEFFKCSKRRKREKGI